MKKDDLTITFSELMKTLDEFRGYRRTPKELTKEQKTFLLKSRDNDCAVPYSQMAKLWTRVGWGKMNASTVRRLYLDLKGQ